MALGGDIGYRCPTDAAPWSGPKGCPLSVVDDREEPREMFGLPAFGFVGPGPLRDHLTALVVAGTKRATSSLLADYEIDGDPLPVVGAWAIVYDSAQQPVVIVETTAWSVATLETVDDDFARAEGEGFADANEWRDAHERYWNASLADYRRDLRDPDFSLTSSTLVVCEWFRVVDGVDPSSLAKNKRERPRRSATTATGTTR